MNSSRFAVIALAAAACTSVDLSAQAGPSLVAEKRAPSSDAIQSYQISSVILGESRRIYVSLPASYSKSAPTRRYPVIIVVDGEELTSPVAAVAAHLSGAGQIPEAVIVGIENTNRLRDLTPPGLSVSGSSIHEGGDKFIDFIEKELLPAIDRQFRGALPRTFVGHSSGGILATYIAATRPSFREVVAIDTPMFLGDNWLVSRLMTRVRASRNTPLHYVSLEARFGWSDETWKALVDSAPASWTLNRQKLEHESHESMGMLASYLGLREVFADYSRIVAPVAPTTSILPYYARLDSTYGGAMIPPKILLSNVTEDLLAEGRGAEARKAFNTLVDAYGPPSNSQAINDRIATVERQPRPAETVESILATPFSTPAEAEKYVGDWVGDNWMSDDEPRTGRETLRIRIVDGKVVGETIHHMPGGEELAQPWTYFRVTPRGMTHGYMNGMRPRGMLLYEGVLSGDVLSGEMVLRGVNFVRPDGQKPPTIHFAFKRQTRSKQ